MARAQLIAKYKDMMYKYGEYDVWDDDIEPKLNSMTTDEIANNYKEDKKFYSQRQAAGGCW